MSLVLSLGLWLAPHAAPAVPFWGAKASQPAGTDPATLAPGQFVWDADAVPAGPIVVVVSLTEQRAYVYRNGIAVGVTTVSTGKPGHTTPTGVFTILQKDKDHHSSKYNDAAMPWAERLTWDGVALHAGGLPGYPSSHGCVHLPSAFARLLFEISPLGMTVVVAAEREAPDDVAHPSLIAPVDAATGAEDEAPRLAANQDQRWQPEKSPQGPVSILMSGADQRALVFRGGVEIGRARLAIRDPQTPLGTHAYVMLAGAGDGEDGQAPGAAKPHWMAVSLPGHAGAKPQTAGAPPLARLSLPPDFAKSVQAILTPGATLVVTDAPALEQTTGANLNVLNGDPPARP
jgi:hypothetical protein